MPKHIAVIMDGNRRFFGDNFLYSNNNPYCIGADAASRFFYDCVSKKVQNITLFALSNENVLQRPKKEIHLIIKAINAVLLKEIDKLMYLNVNIRILGDLSNSIFYDTKDFLYDIQNRTKDNTDFFLNIALNYSGKKEIEDSINKMIKLGIINSNSKITHKILSKFTYFEDKIPEPDIIMRFGGKKRLSGFLTWHSNYSELFFFDEMWPEYNKSHLTTVICDFQKIQRNFGA